MKSIQLIKGFTLPLFVLMLVFITPVQALQLTVSVPPLAGLLKPLLDENDELVVLLKPGVSPHGFQLKPSHLRSIKNSDAVFSIGTPVDSWLDKTLTRVKQPVLKMSALPGLHTLPIRNGGLWLQSVSEKEPQGDAHNSGHEHEVTHAKKKRWHYDGHIWLSMENAVLFVEAAAELIKELKPQQAAAVEQNKQAWLKQLAQLDQELTTTLAPVKDKPYVVLHDAYQYFETHYQLNGVGSIRLNPEIPPSLKRVQQLRASIQKSDIACIFKEPQFPEKRVLAVVRGLDIKIGSLDPMGSFVGGSSDKLMVEGFMPYDDFLRSIARSISSCLTPDSKD